MNTGTMKVLSLCCLTQVNQSGRIPSYDLTSRKNSSIYKRIVQPRQEHPKIIIKTYVAQTIIFLLWNIILFFLEECLCHAVKVHVMNYISSQTIAMYEKQTEI